MVLGLCSQKFSTPQLLPESSFGTLILESTSAISNKCFQKDKTSKYLINPSPALFCVSLEQLYYNLVRLQESCSVTNTVIINCSAVAFILSAEVTFEIWCFIHVLVLPIPLKGRLRSCYKVLFHSPQ